MAGTKTVSLMTPTWAGDLDHYRLLMRSLARSPLAGLEHTTVVQAEDFPRFSQLNNPNTHLLSSEQLLPDKVEAGRRRAQLHHKLLGRHGTRIGGSLSRVTGWPRWPRYTGWHTQQIAKLAAAANASTDYLLVMDSDVIVTPHADLSAALSQEGIVCFSRTQPLSAFSKKTRHWVSQAQKLLLLNRVPDGHYDSYFDTPFLLHVPTVKAMLKWLQRTYQKPWWQALIDQPPRRWSEFATYKLFLQARGQKNEDTAVHWWAPEQMHYIFDASDPDRLITQLRERLANPRTHFITVHSQSSGRQLWSAAGFSDRALELL